MIENIFHPHRQSSISDCHAFSKMVKIFIIATSSRVSTQSSNSGHMYTCPRQVQVRSVVWRVQRTRGEEPGTLSGGSNEPRELSGGFDEPGAFSGGFNEPETLSGGFNEPGASEEDELIKLCVYNIGA